MRIFLISVILLFLSTHSFSQLIGKSRAEILDNNFAKKRKLVKESDTIEMFKAGADWYGYYFNSDNICYKQAIIKNNDSLTKVVSRYTKHYHLLKASLWVDREGKYVYKIIPLESNANTLNEFMIMITPFTAKEFIEYNLFACPLTLEAIKKHIKKYNGSKLQKVDDSTYTSYFAGTSVFYGFSGEYCYIETVLCPYKWKTQLEDYFNSTTRVIYNGIIQAWQNEYYNYSVEYINMEGATGCLYKVELRGDNN